MELWRKVWREGLSPMLSVAGLEALRRALADDDERLVQADTTIPPAANKLLDYPVEAACALAYCGWQGHGLGTVGQVERYFDRLMCACGLPFVRFTNWYDETPREQMRRELLPEVELALAQRRST